jgi:hypothetical protein
MNEQSELQIFLSYANQDQERVLPIYEFLIKNGFPNAWIDCKKLLPGQPWEFEIQKNLRKSEIVIFFLSNVSVNKRGFVQKELKTSLRYVEEKLNSDIYLVPVKLDSDVLVPEELSKFQCLDLNRNNALSLLKESLISQAEKLGLNIDNTVNDLDEIHIGKKNYREVWDGLPGYEVDFSIPIFHSTKFENIGEITKIIEANYLERLHEYRLFKMEQTPDSYSWAQNSYSRTNTFDAHFGSIFHKNYFLSIHYAIHSYDAGAAHPNFGFKGYNFLLNPLIQISSIQSLFKNPSDAFMKIAAFVRQSLLNIPAETDENGNPVGDDKLLDKQWIERGTSDWDCFEAFVFSRDGLELSFPPYQVGPYMVGGHYVTIPYKTFQDDLRVIIKDALWL